MPSTLTAGTLRFVRHCSRFPAPLWYLALDAGQRRDHSALVVLYLHWTAQGQCRTTYEYLFEPQLEIRYLKRFPIGLSYEKLYEMLKDRLQEFDPALPISAKQLVNAARNGQSWQMVCNLTKSRLGGLLEGEPRKDLTAWNNYQRWITTHAMDCAAKPKPGGKGYVIEWAINFDPCLEVSPGVFYDTKLGDRAMGLNIALGDIDEKERGQGNFANFHHEDWFAGTPKGRTRLKDWGTLWIRTATFNQKNAPR